MSIEYVPVAEDEKEDPIEVPTEPDGTILLNSLAAQFPGATGLRYRSAETGAMRAVKLVDGALHKPAELSCWSAASSVYFCTYANSRRRAEYGAEAASYQSKRVDLKRCTDLIVLGLPYKADEEALREYFSQYGQVVMTQVKRDPEGNSKGYGFVRFHDYDSQVSCLGARHQMDGRRCEVKIPNSQADGQAAYLSKRVFVGRITEDLSEAVLREFFGQRGHVEEIYIPKPFRSFAFVTFSDPDVASDLIGQDCVINGVSVHVGPANPKQQTRNAARGFGGGAGGYQGSGDYGQQAGWGAYGGGGGNPPYQDVVNSLASNPQLLAAALHQAYQQQGGDQQQQQPPQQQPQQQQQQQPDQASPHYGGYQAYQQMDSNNGYGYGYQQQQQHNQW